MINEFKKFMKSSALGRALYSPIGYCYRKFYKDPQRRRKLKETGWNNLQYIYKIAEKEGFQVMPIFGTLLGFVRDGGFMPHDNDIDLGVLQGKTAKEVVQLLVEKYGFQFNQGLAYHGVVTEFSVIYKGLSMDFFFLENHDDVTRTTSYYWKPEGNYTDPRQNNVKYIERKQINELKPFKVGGVEVQIPLDAEGELEAIYGNGWKVPDPNFTDSGNNKVVHVSDFGYAVTYKDIINNNIPV